MSFKPLDPGPPTPQPYQPSPKGPWLDADGDPVREPDHDAARELRYRIEVLEMDESKAARSMGLTSEQMRELLDDDGSTANAPD